MSLRLTGEKLLALKPDSSLTSLPMLIFYTYIYSGTSLAGMRKRDKEKRRGGTLRGVVVGGPRFANWHISGGKSSLVGGAQRLQVCRGPPKFANWHISGGKSSLVVVGGGHRDCRYAEAIRPAGGARGGWARLPAGF